MKNYHHTISILILFSLCLLNTSYAFATHNTGPFPPNNSVMPFEPEKSNVNGNSCSDCIPPTLGYDKNGRQIVTDGFSYNGNSVDVLYYTTTPYPLITVNVGEQNIAEFKIFEDKGVDKIRHLDFAFGMTKDESVSESDVMIEYDIDWQGNGTINIVDPYNAIENDSVSIETKTVHCMDDSTHECLLVRIHHTFRAPLQFDIVATNVWDHKRKTWQNYYNHGIHVQGESLNPEKGILVNDNTLRLYPLIENSKHVRIMVDDSNKVYVLSHDGNYYPRSNNSSLYHEVDESRYTRADNSLFGFDMGTVEFAEYKIQHLEKMQLILDDILGGKPIHNPDFENPSFISDPEIKQAVIIDDQTLQKRIAFEQQKASKLFNSLYGV